MKKKDQKYNERRYAYVCVEPCFVGIFLLWECFFCWLLELKLWILVPEGLRESLPQRPTIATSTRRWIWRTHG